MYLPTASRRSTSLLLQLVVINLLIVPSAHAIGRRGTEGRRAAEAYVGQPFGVGRVTVDVLRGQTQLPLSDERFTVLEAKGRVLYPVLKQEPFRQLLRGFLNRNAPRKVTIYFLFVGDAPFELSAFAPQEQGLRVSPVNNSSAHQRLLDDWWQQYTKRFESLRKDRAYPPVAENFLIATLSRRLGLPLPDVRSGLFSGMSSATNVLSDLIIDEAGRLEIDREMLAPATSAASELVELPAPILWPSPQLDLGDPTEVEIEPLATHVPQECFYVRFGSFSNYFWFRDLNEKWQGDLGNMLFRRGIKRGVGERIQQQLSLKENMLAKIVGPQVIDDAALIGLDPYVQQGAALGILFQGKNDFLLSADMMNQRRRALQLFDDATEETVEIEGQEVSLISTPDGTVRTFYVKHDGFHLVATSSTLVERFLQAGNGQGALADLASFRRARHRLPLARDDTMFAFVSSEFWQNLSSPHYFIENQRRLRSTREPILLQLAGFATQLEGQGQEILPPGFGTRVDGSALQSVDDDYLDSRRGRPGCYLPIADIGVDRVSRAEADRYQQFKTEVEQNLDGFPPLAVAIGRTDQDASTTAIRVDVFAQGALRKQLGLAGAILGEPSQQRLAPIAGDLLAVEAVVDSNSLSFDKVVGEEQHVFGALRDFRSPLTVKRGAVRPDGPPTELVRGYLGAWPKPGLLSFFNQGNPPAGQVPEPVDGPMAPIIGGELWQAKLEDFLLLSFKPDVVAQVLPQLLVEPGNQPAQLWVRLEDLTGTQMAENVRAFGYMGTRSTSAAGSRMMNALANQLQVPRNQCRAVAEQLVDGQFVCPLGGEYQLFAPSRGLEVWASSALPESNRFLLTEVPEDFQLPMLGWFRGLEGTLHLGAEQLEVHLEVAMSKDALP